MEMKPSLIVAPEQLMIRRTMDDAPRDIRDGTCACVISSFVMLVDVALWRSSLGWSVGRSLLIESHFHFRLSGSTIGLFICSPPLCLPPPL